MNTLVKKLREKWQGILVVLIVLTLCGGIIGNVINDRYQRNSVLKNNFPAQEIFYDLLYLENNDNLKLNREQAALLLPLIEKLTIDESITNDLFKEVYSALTPQQYMALLNRESSNDYGSYIGTHDRRKDLKPRGHDSIARKEYSEPREEALGNIVIQLLKAKINEPPSGNQVPAQPSTNNNTGVKP